MIKTHLPILMSCSGNLHTIELAMIEEGASEKDIKKIKAARELINSYINP